jgi:Rrf2 family transcriptional regulator, nitric oxide-sensitive transcriptional repressor
MFSQTSEYALRVVAFLAGQGEQPATTKQIAAATRIPEGYLAKVIQSLGRAGILASQRGMGGGSVLAIPPESLTLYQVVDAIDPMPRIRTCPLGLRSHGKNLCAVHRKLDDAMASVEKTLNDATLAAMMREPNKSKPLCEVGPDDPMPSGRFRLAVVKR